MTQRAAAATTLRSILLSTRQPTHRLTPQSIRRRLTATWLRLRDVLRRRRVFRHVLMTSNTVSQQGPRWPSIGVLALRDSARAAPSVALARTVHPVATGSATAVATAREGTYARRCSHAQTSGRAAENTANHPDLRRQLRRAAAEEALSNRVHFQSPRLSGRTRRMHQTRRRRPWAVGVRGFGRPRWVPQFHRAARWRWWGWWEWTRTWDHGCSGSQGLRRWYRPRPLLLRRHLAEAPGMGGSSEPRRSNEHDGPLRGSVSSHLMTLARNPHDPSIRPVHLGVHSPPRSLVHRRRHRHRPPARRP